MDCLRLVGIKKLENPTIKYVLEVLQKFHLVRVVEDTYEYGFSMNII
jgi:hypothetical protein